MSTPGTWLRPSPVVSGEHAHGSIIQLALLWVAARQVLIKGLFPLCWDIHCWATWVKCNTVLLEDGTNTLGLQFCTVQCIEDGPIIIDIHRHMVLILYPSSVQKVLSVVLWAAGVATGHCPRRTNHTEHHVLFPLTWHRNPCLSVVLVLWR